MKIEFDVKLGALSHVWVQELPEKAIRARVRKLMEVGVWADKGAITVFYPSSRISEVIVTKK